MDAGVLQLHVFEHDPSYEPMKLADGETIETAYQRNHPIQATAEVSLVIPTHFNTQQKAGALKHLLADIEDCQCIQELILVAADGNTRSVDAIIKDAIKDRSKFSSLHVTSAPPNRRAEARNIGAELSTKPYLMFLDDDMVVHDWPTIDIILSEMLTGNFDAALFPRRNYAKFPMLYQPEALGNLIRAWKYDVPNLPEDCFLDPVKDGSPFKTLAFCFPGCFTLIRKEAFDRIGGFPSGFVGWGFEDADFAMRAIRQLNVLNLFRKSAPLLHIDHPVSPYKSDEYRRNMRTFNATYNTTDMDWLCRSIFEGEDFHADRAHGLSSDRYIYPMTSAIELLQLDSQEKNMDLDEENSSRGHQALLRNYQHILDVRLNQGIDPIPRNILLHGSRGDNTHQDDSDYDLLVLFRGGNTAEHFVTQTLAGTVEVEAVGMGKFEQIAAAAVIDPRRGPMELAKIAQSRVIWGDENEFNKWRTKVLSCGVQIGLPVWLLYGIGSRQAKDGRAPVNQNYFSAIAKLVNSPWNQPHAVAELLDVQIEKQASASLLHSAQPVGAPLGIHAASESFSEKLNHSIFEPGENNALIAATRELMDRCIEGWREDMVDHKRVFAIQPPEIWSALRLLMGDSSVKQ